MSESLDASVIRSWALKALEGLGETRAEIDGLNVFPVPDGDTGTNLFLTMESALQSVEVVMPEAVIAGAALPPAGAVMKAYAQGALLGARGNSGVITSQLLRGFSDIVNGAVDGSPLGARGLVDALTLASELAYGAVGEPREGTVLTVSRIAAEAASTALAEDPSAGLTAVAAAAVDGAQIALDDTPNLLPVLKEAGVVDSGGRGLVVILDALLEAITGEHRARQEYARADASITMEAHTVTYGGPGYEVMYLLESRDAAVSTLRSQLGALGDSLVVVGGDDLWNVHVHVDDVGAAIEAGIEAGRPYRIKVTHLEQAEAILRSGRGESVADSTRHGRSLVAVAHGSGVKELLLENSVTVVDALPGRRPSTAELLDGIARSGAREVVLLPSDGDTRTVAEAAAEQAREEGLRVAVIPTRSIVQTLAAVAVHDQGAHFDDAIVSMGRASAATRYGAVTVAVKDAVTTAGTCHVDDVLGLVDGDIVEIEDSLTSAAERVIERMLASGGELFTVVSGKDADAKLVASVVATAERVNPDVEVEVIEGHQPLWPLILGVE
ncbi:MAG: DAK2 domain-containing protein [Candidatus Nanopelagicales bacterium]